MDEDDRFHHHPYLRDVTLEDARLVAEKDRSYGASWKKRGGGGAFMMLARKWDRLEQMVSQLGRFGGGESDAQPYDVFQWIRRECETAPTPHHVGSDGTVLAEVRDLRRYLLLVEAEMVARGAVPAPPRKEPEREDLYSEAAQRWGCSREEAREKIYQYALSKTNPYALLAEHLDISPEEVRLRMAMPLTENTRTRPADVRLVPRRVPEDAGSGTPEDGGHHAAYDAPEESWGGQRYPLEANTKERSEMPPDVQGMYRWYEGESKWRMEEPYRRRWCRDEFPI